MPTDQITPTENDEIGKLDIDRGIQAAEDHANSGYYQPGDKKPVSVGDVFKRRRKQLIVAGSAGGLLAGLFTLAFLFLAPFKLDFFSQNIENARFARLTHIFDTRSNHFIRSLIAADIAGTKSGENAYFKAKGWDSTNPFVKVYKSWSVNGLEARLRDQQGIQFVRQRGQDGVDRLVKIDVSSGPLDFRDKGLFDKNGIWTGDPKLLDEKILEVFNTNQAGRQAINNAVASVTRGPQILRRRHLRLWAREKLGIKKWTFFEGTKEKTREAIRTRWTNAVDGYFKNGNFIRCLFELDCPKTANINTNDNVARMTTPTSDNLSSDSEKSLTELEKEGGADVRTGESETIAAKGLKLVASKSMQEFAAKIMSSVNPIIAIVNILDTLKKVDKLFGKEEGLVKVLAVARATEYATAFMNFRTLTDQVKAGDKLSPEEVDAALTMFNGAENSDSYQQVAGNPPAKQQTQASATPSLIGKAFAAANTDSNNDTSTAYAAVTDNLKVNSQHSVAQKITDFYQATFGKLINLLLRNLRCSPTDPSSWLGCAVDGLLNIINAVLNIFGNIGSHVFDFLDGLITGHKIKAALGGVIEKGIEFLGGAPACTGHETGGQLMNCVVGGADVTQSAFLQSAGGVHLSDSQIAELDRAAGQDQQLALDSQSLWHRLTSLSDSRSFAAQIVMHLPNNRQQLFSQITSFATSLLPSNWFGSIKHSLAIADTPLSQQVYAAANTNLFNVSQYGFTEKQLAAEPFGGKTAKACQAETDKFDATLANSKDPTAPSMCKLDEIVANSLTCLFTSTDNCGTDDGQQDSGIVPPGGDAATLAKQMLSSSKISYVTPAAKQAIEDTANGRPAKIDCRDGSEQGKTAAYLNPSLLSTLLGATNQYSIGIGYLTNGCHTTGSYHYTGDAADINTINGQQSDGVTQLDWNFTKYLMTLLPSGSGIGQKQCMYSHVQPVPPGIRFFNDACTHIHFQVPRR